MVRNEEEIRKMKKKLQVYLDVKNDNREKDKSKLMERGFSEKQANAIIDLSIASELDNIELLEWVLMERQ